MEGKLTKQEWYENLVEECRAIITEAVFTSRWALVEGYWKLGERIREEKQLKKWTQNEAGEVLQGLAKDLSISTRTLYYALQAYDKFPDINKLPEGKNISWNKLITKYLPEPKQNEVKLTIPKGKYGLIAIDPPWKYGTEYDSETRRVASPYKELSQDELKELKIPSTNDCVLWLWSTHKFLWDAKELLQNWDFEYKLTLVWNKEKMGMGTWLRCQTEFCLLGIKGKPQWNLTNERDILVESRREHSRKPESFYEMAKKLTPVQGLDMFGRESRNGWDVWGNEPNKF